MTIFGMFISTCAQAFFAEVQQAISVYLGHDASLSDVRRVLTNPEDSQRILQILLGSITIDRIERVVSSLYVTFVTCLAAGLSENAAKFGLAFNVSSSIAHALYRLLKPAVPENRPLVGFFTRAVCTSLGVFCAFRLEKSLLVWANCLLGAELIISSIELLLLRKSRELPDENDKPLSRFDSCVRSVRTSVIWSIAGVGLVYQLMPGREMNFWLKGILFGPRMLEYGLQTLSVGIKGSQNRVLLS